MRRWLVVIGLLVGGCGEGSVFGSSIDGTVDAEVEQFKAKWNMQPNGCYSGEHQAFFGVDLVEDDNQDTLVRIISSPMDGYSIGTNIPGQDGAVFFTAADPCETFDVQVQRTGTKINGYWNVEGHAVVDCVLPGFTFHVDVNFSGCH